jgi:YD repeat-containing protein
MPEKKASPKSERERAGLRGLVHQCTEERTTPAISGRAGSKYTVTTDYDREGRTLSVTMSNPDGSKSRRENTYDAEGRLVKVGLGQPGTALKETSYRYDQKGNPVETGKDALSNITTFEYDQQGRKIKIVKSGLPPSANGPYGSASVGMSLEEGDDLYYPAPNGGMVKTLYDENDRATESQIYGSDGRMIERLVRTYDSAGRVSETKMVIEDVIGIFPAKEREEILADPEAAADFKRQLTAFLGAQGDLFKTTYAYDTEGRVAEKHDHLGGEETVTKSTYNSYGDKILEHQATSGSANPPANEPRSEVPAADTRTRESEVTYTYKYDAHGNWTEQITHYGSQPGGPAENSNVCRRTITYY